MKPGRRIYIPCSRKSRLSGSSGAVYPYGVTDTLSEQKTLKSWQAVWLENDYIKVMILPELGGRVHRAWIK